MEGKPLLPPSVPRQPMTRSELFAARLEAMAARHRQTDLEVSQARQELLSALNQLQTTARQLTSD